MNKTSLFWLFFVFLSIFSIITEQRQIPSSNTITDSIIDVGVQYLKKNIALQSLKYGAKKSSSINIMKILSKKVASKIKPIFYIYMFYGISVAAYNINYTIFKQGSLSGSFQGQGYSYQNISKNVKKYLQLNKILTNIYIYMSPLQTMTNFNNQVSNEFDQLKNSSVINQILNIQQMLVFGASEIVSDYAKEFVFHYEVILQIEEMVYILFSFGSDGLENIAHVDLDQLVQRRNGNILLFSKKLKMNSNGLIDYLKLKQTKTYNFINWNCKHFIRGLIDHLDLKQIII